MLEQNQLQQRDIMHLHETGGTFHVGEAQVQVLQAGSLDKPARKMMSQVNALAAHMQLPLQTHDTTHRALRHLRRAGTKEETKDYFVETDVEDKTFWLLVRSPLDGRTIDEAIGDNPPKINIVTGPCLFSAHSALAVTEDGEVFPLTDPQKETVQHKPIATLQIADQMSYYEVEATLRLSSLIEKLARNSPYVENVFLNIPRVEYYLYILDFFRQGLISPELATAWFDEVDKRNENLTSKLGNRLAKNVPLSVNVLNHAPLDPIGAYIRHMVSEGNNPDLTHALEMLKQSSELWEDIIQTSPPDSWQELNYLGYVYADLSAGITSTDSQNQTIAIAIEDPNEMRIFIQAKYLARNLPERDHHYNVVAMYPHETVIPKQHATIKGMYYLQEEGSRRKNLYAAFEAYGKNVRREQSNQ